MKNFYLIGLTGNLGSGKSTVRRLLEELGARGIDADLLARYTVGRGTPTWHSVIDLFGWEVVKFNGELDRASIGTRVFADSAALAKLEAVVHPAVGALLQQTLRHNEAPVVALEAIKLVEAGLHHWCDTVWVVKCDPAVQVQRVMRDRQTSEADARARLAAQGPLEEKLRVAQVVIDNSGPEAETRAQVLRAWTAIRPETAKDKSNWLTDYLAAPAALRAETREIKAVPNPNQIDYQTVAETIQVRRASRKDLDALGKILMQMERRTEPFSSAELLRRFGERGYSLGLSGKRIVALAAWEAENLVATVREIWAESEQAAARALPQLLALLEKEARALTCETILLLIEETAPGYLRVLCRELGYQERALSALHPTWRQAAKDRVQKGEQIWVKRLREQLVTTPI